MTRFRPSRFWRALAFSSAALAVTMRPEAVVACAACYGQSDSPLAMGLNWGIMSLLVVVVSVLGGFATFFVYLVRRAAAMPQVSAPAAEAHPAAKSDADLFTS